MKNTIKKLNYYLLLFTALIFISCEKDLYDEAIQKDKNILVKNISLSELSRKDNAKLFSSVDEVRNKKKNIQGKIVYDSINDIYFDDQSGKYIEREDGYKSYTFPILKYGSGDKKIENIVFSLNEIGEYDVFKAKYDFTKEEMENLTEQEMASQNIIYTGITQGKLGQIVCINTVKWISYTIDEGNNEGDFGYTGEWIATSYHCYNMADNTGSFAGGGGDTDGPIDAPSNSGTSVGQSGGGSISTTPIALTPTQAGMAAFMHDFNDKQLDWYNNQDNATLNSITNYLVQNDFSPESTLFVYQFINQMVNNSNLNLDINASSKSPVFIDLSKVKTDDPNDPLFSKKKKFMCVYNKLLQSSKFKDLFVDMFQNNIKPNVTFEITDLPGNANSGLVGQTIPTSNDGYNNTIQIDTDLLDSGNNMLIANTILHECVHAFLHVKLADPSIGISIPNLNNMDLKDCINSYYGLFNNNQNQHAFIYNYLIPTMATILSQIKDSLVDNTTNSQMQLIQINNSTGSTPWNWNDYFNNQALDGLEQCQFFISEIATIGSNGLPTVTVDFNKWFKYNEYKSKSRQNLNNNCNN